MTNELCAVLEKHKDWLYGKGGERADLSGDELEVLLP